MSFTRREFGKLALGGLPAVAVLSRNEEIFGAFAQAKPNSLINGVQVGTITYSYRSMPDQSAEATLRYIVDSGISSIELMGGPVESYAGAPSSGRGGGAGRGPGGPGGQGGAGGAAGAGGAPGAGGAGGARGGRGQSTGPIDPSKLAPGERIGEWQGHQCVIA